MSLTGNTTELKIWNFLIGKGLNACGVAGLMGNLYAESALNPRNLQNNCESRLGLTDDTYTKAVDNGSYTNFVRDSAGYGLAQWTFWRRKQGLLKYAKAAGASVGDLEIQLCFLFKELLEDYTAVLAILKTAETVWEASDAVLTKFERPTDQSDAAKIRRAGYGQKYFDTYAGNWTDPAETMTEGENMKASELIKKLQNIADNYSTLYVMGCFGAPLTGENVSRYCQNHQYNKQAGRTAMIRAAANQNPPVYGFDCVNLIKGVLWGWRGDASKTYGGAQYAANGVPDISADGMAAKFVSPSTDFKTIIPGEAVWLSGHIGVYIGGGKVIECTPAFKNGVQVTACLNIGAISGMNGRRWTKHGRIPYITYDTANVQPFTSGGITAPPVMRVGARVKYSGPVYRDSNGNGQGKTVNGTYTVRYYLKGRRYGVHIDDLGWVPESACSVME